MCFVTLCSRDINILCGLENNTPSLIDTKGNQSMAKIKVFELLHGQRLTDKLIIRKLHEELHLQSLRGSASRPILNAMKTNPNREDKMEIKNVRSLRLKFPCQ